MKHIRILPFLFFTTSIRLAAQSTSSEVLQAYQSATSDSAKISCMVGYLNQYITNDSLVTAKSFELLDHFTKQNDDFGRTHMQIYIASLAAARQDYVTTLNYALPLLPYFEAQHDTAQIISELTLIMHAYDDSRNFNAAVKYAKRNIPISIAKGKKANLLIDYQNIGTLYAEAFNSDSGLLYSQKALKVARELKDDGLMNGALLTMAENYIVAGGFTLAVFTIRDAMQLKIDTTNLVIGIWSNNDFAQAFLGLKQYDSAIFYARRSIPYSLRRNDGKQLLRSYEYISSSYDAIGQTDSSNRYFRLKTSLKDSLFSIEKTKEVEAAGFRELWKQQETRDALTQADLKQQKLQRNAFIGGFALMLILAGVSYRNFRRKKKDNLIIAQQKGIVEAKQKEVMDSIRYASRIQNSLLTNEKYIEKNMERLKKND